MEQKTCGECGHKVAARMIRCLYCGATMASAESKPSRDCPRCKSGMQEVPSKWVAIDRCSSCEGEYFDHGEVDRSVKLEDRGMKWLSDNMFPRPADTESGEPLRCPGCSSEMRTFVVSSSADLKIDVCSKCKGTWLDKGEPAKLRSAIHDGMAGTLKPVGLADAGQVDLHGWGRHSCSSYGYRSSLGSLGAEIVIEGLIDILSSQ